jgi:hypothetical protein
LKQSSLLLLGKAESDVSVAIARILPRRKDFGGPERQMLDDAVAMLVEAREKLRALQPRPRERL